MDKQLEHQLTQASNDIISLDATQVADLTDALEYLLEYKPNYDVLAGYDEEQGMASRFMSYNSQDEIMHVLADLHELLRNA